MQTFPQSIQHGFKKRQEPRNHNTNDAVSECTPKNVVWAHVANENANNVTTFMGTTTKKDAVVALGMC